ncbi:MAG: nucleoside kinase [Clostridiales Family XIII bacterium]|jgi:uridine kinase|nr:nucleoside kinase [Clostridiales Family XIII bacterium]
MDLTIKLTREIGGVPEELRVPEGTSIESLYLEQRSHLPYRVITARVDGDDVSLNDTLVRDCEVVLCDIRDNIANRAFQRGLSLIYLKAVRETLGAGTHVLIHNSVNRGIYTTIEFAGDADGDVNRLVTEQDLRRIEKRMWEIVDANIPIAVNTVGKDALLKYLERIGDKEKIKLLQCAPELSFVGVSNLDGYTNYFYGIMPSSTGYIQSFALDLYHGGVLVRFPHTSDPLTIPMYTRDDKIFEAYQNEQKILDAFDLAYISDIDRALASGQAGEMIRMAEDLHAAKIEDLAEKIADSGRRVILIAGPSSSGKTTFAKRLIAAIGQRGQEPLYLGTDDYFTEREDAPRDKNGEFNFEGLSAMDVGLFTSSINDLLAGKETDIPRFDFLTGKKIFGERIEKLAPGQSVVVEGIHALNRKMSKGVDDAEKFKIYISPLTQLNIDDHNRVPSTDIRLLRRMLRDNRTRGNGPRDTIKGWPKVRQGESINIFPYNSEADEVFNSTILYELPVIRKYAEPLLEEIRPGDAEYGYAKWLLYFLRFFRPMEDKDEALIPKESILREFIG